MAFPLRKNTLTSPTSGTLSSGSPSPEPTAPNNPLPPDETSPIFISLAPLLVRAPARSLHVTRICCAGPSLEAFCSGVGGGKGVKQQRGIPVRASSPSSNGRDQPEGDGEPRIWITGLRTPDRSGCVCVCHTRALRTL